MTTDLLKQRLVKLKEEEKLFRLSLMKVGDFKLTPDKMANYRKLTLEIHLIEHLVRVRSGKGILWLDFLFSFFTSSIFLFESYRPLVATALFLMNGIFLFGLLRETRKVLEAMHHSTLTVWVLDPAEGTLPNWRRYVVQMKRRLKLHGLFFISWLIPILMIISFNHFVLIIPALLALSVGLWYQYRGIRFDWLDDYHQIALAMMRLQKAKNLSAILDYIDQTKKTR